jgi:UrcA family protein
MTNLIARIATVAALALATVPVVAVGAAHAETRDKTTIGVSDLDFARSSDVARFGQRVNQAAYKVCPSAGRAGLRAAAACEMDVKAQAVEKLGSRQKARMTVAANPASSFTTAAN